MNKHQQCRVGAYLIHSGTRPSIGAFSDLHLVDTQDEGMYGSKSRDTWEGERP
jgi:hypothetical protein